MPSQPAYAGIDIGGTNIKFGLVDPKGKVLYREQRPTMADKGADPLMHLVANLSESLLYHAAEEDFEVKWLGVGTPGAVDWKSGKVLGVSPNITGWQGVEIGTILRDRLNMPVLVDNDVNVMALAESRFGAAIGYRSVVCVAVGTGVGGGLILDGRLWRGAGHAAGEIGHMSINATGPKCRCGSNGCLESYCNSSAIITRLTAKLSNGLTPVFEEVLEGSLKNLSIKKLFAAARKNDEIAVSVIQETAEYLSIGIANVVNLLNPEIVVIGGGVADGGAGFVEAVAGEVRKRALNPAAENVRISKATLGNDAGFIGAGILGEAPIIE
ncbi:MAG: ROK family protein [candidate division Zixibacteria bacterium]|nr:ROK family protein [candidate division Zixibacteria bacterium]